MFLHEKRVRSRRMHRDPMDAVANLRMRIGNVLRMQTAIDWLPGFAAVISAERARGRDRDEHSLSIFWIDQNRVQTHSARARLPLRAGIVLAEPGKFVPRFAAVFRLEQRGVFHARVNMISVIERRLKMPDALELPRMLRAVVPHVRAGD